VCFVTYDALLLLHLPPAFPCTTSSPWPPPSFSVELPPQPSLPSSLCQVQMMGAVPLATASSEQLGSVGLIRVVYFHNTETQKRRGNCSRSYHTLGRKPKSFFAASVGLSFPASLHHASRTAYSFTMLFSSCMPGLSSFHTCAGGTAGPPAQEWILSPAPRSGVSDSLLMNSYW
jgi:hypothetical protein